MYLLQKFEIKGNKDNISQRRNERYDNLTTSPHIVFFQKKKERKSIVFFRSGAPRRWPLLVVVDNSPGGETARRLQSAQASKSPRPRRRLVVTCKDETSYSTWRPSNAKWSMMLTPAELSASSIDRYDRLLICAQLHPSVLRTGAHACQ